MSNPESLDNPSGATGAEPPFDEDGQHDPRLLTSGDAEAGHVEPGAVDVTEADNTAPADRDDDADEVGDDATGELGDPADLPEAPEGDDDPEAGADEDPDGDPGTALPDDPHDV